MLIPRISDTASGGEEEYRTFGRRSTPIRNAPLLLMVLYGHGDPCSKLVYPCQSNRRQIPGLFPPSLTSSLPSEILTRSHKTQASDTSASYLSFCLCYRLPTLHQYPQSRSSLSCISFPSKSGLRLWSLCNGSCLAHIELPLGSAGCSRGLVRVLPPARSHGARKRNPPGRRI